MTREKVQEKVVELTRDLSDDELQHLVSELLSRRHGWTVSESDWEKLDQAEKSVAEGNGVRVDDVDAFLAECESASRS